MWLPFGASLSQNGFHMQLILENKTKNDYNSVDFPDIKLKCDLVVAESHS